MTVKHLQSIQRQHLSAAVATDPTVIHKFKTGFNECATEVSRYIGSLEGIDGGVKKRLIEHLSGCITTPAQPFSIPPIPSAFTNTPPELQMGNVDDLNNNHDGARFQGVPGLQLIPSRLPSGELALLLPNASSLSSLFPGSSLDIAGSRSRTSAFTPVSKDSKSGNTIEDATATISYESSHSEVSSTSNDGLSFKAPRTPTKSHTTSSSSLLIPVTELQSQFKKGHTPHTLCSSERSVFKPLTIYTDPCYELSPSRRSPPLSHKSPLDFSLKREGDDVPSSTNRGRKRPLEDLSCNVQLPAKSMRLRLEPENEKLVKLEPRNEGLECDSGRDVNVTNDSGASGDMWRPW